jgi:hypothetical protein|tara:strand:+ start:541 stop:930 length:390 start_codon:yes stop_codon:yes gene_type:complete
MSLLKRFAFYFGGFAIGLILLYFFIGGSGASCEYDYGPNSRTLKNIRLKERVYTNEALDALKNNQIDTSDISNLLLKGDVLFSQSNTKLDSCDVYVIEGAHKGKPKEKLKISVENCNKIATIQKISIIK